MKFCFIYFSDHIKVLRQLFESDAGGEILVSGAYELYKEQASAHDLKPLDINRFGLLVKNIFPEPIVQKKRKVFKRGCPRACMYADEFILFFKFQEISMYGLEGIAR